MILFFIKIIIKKIGHVVVDFGLDWSIRLWSQSFHWLQLSSHLWFWVCLWLWVVHKWSCQGCLILWILIDFWILFSYHFMGTFQLFFHSRSQTSLMVKQIFQFWLSPHWLLYLQSCITFLPEFTWIGSHMEDMLLLSCSISCD